MPNSDIDALWHTGLKERIAEVIADNDGVGFWHSCTGCHETNEGASTGFYPFAPEFQCEVGAGCRECGGIGVIWDGIDYSDFAEFCADQDDKDATILALRDQLAKAEGALRSASLLDHAPRACACFAAKEPTP